MSLIEELYGEGKISDQKKDDLRKAVMRKEGTEEELILKNKIVDEDYLFQLKSRMLKFPLLKPKAEEVPLEVLDLISEEAAVNYKMIPVFRKENLVGIGMVYPENTLAQNALRFLSQRANFAYKVYLVSFSDFNNVLKQRRSLKRETKKVLTEFSTQKGEMLEALAQDPASVKISDDAPIIKMVLVILRHAIEGNASDIHIEPGRDKLNIRFRQDGVLHLSLFLPLSVHASIVSRIKILANLKIDETRLPQDGRFSAKINGKNIDFRVATFPTLYGEKVEIRVLDQSGALKSFDAIGLTGKNLDMVQRAIKSPYGLILSSGPTGSGKTTTLYSFLRSLNKDSVNIVTIEDPIEYSVDGVNQSQVRPEIGYGFSDALRQILRQDPNIIMVGEIRDEETAGLVINSALTGHLVLSTIHTNSAVGVIPRLIDMGVRPFLIPSALRLAISQRLVRVLCDRCKKKVLIRPEAEAYIAEALKNLPVVLRKEIEGLNSSHLYEANGCEVCNFEGYTGRIGLFEVLPMTDELASVILNDPVESVILKAAQKQGMLTMVQEGIKKVFAGQTTIDEIIRVTEYKG